MKTFPLALPKGVQLFSAGFSQVFLIAVNTTLIAHRVIWALFSFTVSWTWRSSHPLPRSWSDGPCGLQALVG